MHVVVASRLSLEQYSTVQFTEKRSRMSAVRIDCSGSGSNVITSTRWWSRRRPSRSRSRSRADDEDGTGHGGIGFGSFHRCGERAVSVSDAGGRERRALTLNSRSLAVGVMILTSWAVDALCIAFGPGAAKETLPTSTF